MRVTNDECGWCDGTGYRTLWLDSTEPACRKWSVPCRACRDEDSSDPNHHEGDR